MSAGSIYTFLPFVRSGAAALLDAVSPAAAASPSVSIWINDRDRITVPLKLYTAGDVIGFDPRVVVRTEPSQAATGFPPNFLPFVEFDQPDFPWMLTPFVAADAERRPWLCLVVVPRETATLSADRRGALPVLTCPRGELPDLDDLWAWTHAQVVRTDQETTDTVLRNAPHRNVSRIVCPRHLEPNRSYYACVVPSFAAGAAAGLGEPTDNGTAAAAWTAPATAGEAAAMATLPVLYSWEFSTGAGGDFESLVRALNGGAVSPDVGVLDVDLTAAGSGLPASGSIRAEGALASPTMVRSDWPGHDGQEFQGELGRLLDGPVTIQGVPTVLPPRYGGWYTNAASPASPGAPAWLRDLNLDPRYRVAAALGARIVQEQQEFLMASAWEQFGDIRRANQLLAQAQLARAASESIHEKRLSRIANARLLHIAGPALSRVLRDTRTYTARLRHSALPESTLSPAFRRVVRPGGPLARHQAAPDAGRLLLRLAQAELAMPRQIPDGLVSLDDAMRLAKRDAAAPAAPPISRLGDVTADLILAAARSVPVRIFPFPRRGSGPAPGAAAIDRLRTAVAAAQSDLLSFASTPQAPPLPPLAVDDEARALLPRLAPALTLVSRIGSLVRRPPESPPAADPLDLVSVRPDFPQPMYEALCGSAPEFMLPHLDRVPPNTIAQVATNRRFIEAFLVGLNHEMGRELFWRGFPTDGRGTYFRHFWNSPDASSPDDIGDLTAWQSSLGSNQPDTSREPLVLLIRGELVRRYPGAIIYMSRAGWATDGSGRVVGSEEKQPVFRGGIDPDVVFVAFDLSIDDARGSRTSTADPGWYLVIQEQPTEPRFGFDEAATGSPPNLEHWRDLSWSHFAPDGSMRGPYLRVAGPLLDTVHDGVRWGTDSASMARIALRQPVRLAVHTDTILPS